MEKKIVFDKEKKEAVSDSAEEVGKTDLIKVGKNDWVNDSSSKDLMILHQEI